MEPYNKNTTLDNQAKKVRVMKYNALKQMETREKQKENNIYRRCNHKTNI